jgi:transcriptional regulator with XRE-family HTH domain
MMTLGEAIWYARDLRGVTQLQLAASLHISRPQIANIETGRGNPSIETLEEIARVLACQFTTDGDYWTATTAGNDGT